MLKSDLIANICTKIPHLPERVVTISVHKIIDWLSEAMASNERIEIRDFGRFVLHYHKTHKAHNPKTGAPVVALAKYSVHFKPGKGMRDRVNAKQKG